MRLPKILLIGSIVLGLIAAILMIVAFADYDPAVSNYFPQGSALPVVAVILTFLSVAVGMAAVIFSRHKEPLFETSFPTGILFPAVFGSLLTGVFLLIEHHTVPGVLFILESLFLFLAGFSLGKRFSNIVVCFGFFAVAAHVSLIATYYFDMSVEMNAPVKELVIVGLLVSMLECTIEMRLLLKRSHTMLTPFLIILTAAFGTLSSFSLAIAYLQDKIPMDEYAAAIPVLLGFSIISYGREILVLNSSFQTVEKSIKDHTKGDNKP